VARLNRGQGRAGGVGSAIRTTPALDPPRFIRTLRWWADCIEHWGWLGWHRDLWLRSITVERAIDATTDQLLARVQRSPTVTKALKDHAAHVERELAQLRALRSPLRRSQFPDGSGRTGTRFRDTRSDSAHGRG
jgi:hypothetical protein